MTIFNADILEDILAGFLTARITTWDKFVRMSHDDVLGLTKPPDELSSVVPISIIARKLIANLKTMILDRNAAGDIYAEDITKYNKKDFCTYCHSLNIWKRKGRIDSMKPISVSSIYPVVIDGEPFTVSKF